MKTVEEANKTVCHRGAGNETAVFCRADICMAWRWKRAETDRLKYPKVNAQDERGYCGLAGKPE